MRAGANNHPNFHKGVNGRWKDVLSPSEIARCDEVAARNLAPDCAHWLATPCRSRAPCHDCKRPALQRVGRHAGAGSAADARAYAVAERQARTARVIALAGACFKQAAIGQSNDQPRQRIRPGREVEC